MPEVDLKNARGDLLVCDVVPNPPETRLVKTARARGFKVLTGLPMLVYQGAIGFEMWTGRRREMRAALEKAFSLGRRKNENAEGNIQQPTSNIKRGTTNAER